MANYQETKNKYLKEKVDEIKVYVPKGTKEAIKKYAEQNGVSVNDLIKTAITEKTGIDLRRHTDQ